MSSLNSESSLRQKLYESVHKKVVDGTFLGDQPTQCLPPDEINNIATKTNIFAMFEEEDPSTSGHPSNWDLEKLAETTFGHAKRLFVIALYGRVNMSFLHLLNEERHLNDINIPIRNLGFHMGQELQFRKAQHILPLQTKNKSLVRSSTISGIPVKIEREIGDGNDGTVYEGRVHCSYREVTNLLSTKMKSEYSPSIAIKHLTQNEGRNPELDFVREMEKHKIVDKHIVTCYDMFEVQNIDLQTGLTISTDAYLISELADNEFHKYAMKNAFVDDEAAFDWLADQMIGLTAALCKFHIPRNFVDYPELLIGGSHHDITTDNILVFHDAGKLGLKLTDFGCAKFSPLHEVKRSFKGTHLDCAPNMHRGNQMFFPPETFMDPNRSNHQTVVHAPAEQLSYSTNASAEGEFEYAQTHPDLNTLVPPEPPSGSNPLSGLRPPPDMAETSIPLSYATSQPHDIWSLGCVFLLLLTWVACGSSAYRKLYYSYGGIEAWFTPLPLRNLREAIRHELDNFRRSEKWNKVADCIEEMLQYDVKDRWTASHLHEQLKERLGK